MNEEKTIETTPSDRFIHRDRKISLVYGSYLVEKPHKHEFIELSYVVEGEAEHLVNGETLPLKKGDVFLLDQGAVHSYKATTPTIVICNIVFLPEFLDNILTESDNFMELACKIILSKNVVSDSADGGFLFIPKEKAGPLFPLLEALKIENDEKPDGYLEAMQAYLKLLLIKIFRIRGEGEDSIPQGQKKVVVDIIRYIKEHDNVDFSIAEMSRALFFSSEYISRLFKSYTNQSIIEYIRAEKMKKAGRLLMTTDMPVESVMAAVGYSDKKYFYQIFQASFGMSPGKYRNRAQ